MRKHQYLAYLAAILLLAACVNPLPISCDQITMLRNQMGVVFSPQDFQQWVRTTYQIPDNAIMATNSIMSDRQDVDSGVRWQARGTQYDAQFGKGELLRLSIGKWNATSGDQLLACLGQPSHYYSYAAWEENGPWHRVYLFFPEQGVFAHGSDHWRGAYKDPIPAIDGKFPIDALLLVKPGSLEQLLTAGWGDLGPRRILQESKPWPGAWEKIEFAYKSSLEQ